MNNSTPSPVFVYFISAGYKPVKIGISNDPESRLVGLQTAHYKQLRLLFSIECETLERARDLERAFHGWYEEKRLLNEWFDVTPNRVQKDLSVLHELSRSAANIQIHIAAAELEKIEARRERQISSGQRVMGEVIQYLRDNPEACALPGRELETSAVLSNGKRVSYRTWNDGKKILSSGLDLEPGFVESMLERFDG